MFVGLSNGMKMTSNSVFLFLFQHTVVRHFNCELHFLDKLYMFDWEIFYEMSILQHYTETGK